MGNYWRFSRSAYYSVVSALPLQVVYEILVIMTQSRYWGIRNAADMFQKGVGKDLDSIFVML